MKLYEIRLERLNALAEVYDDLAVPKEETEEILKRLSRLILKAGADT